MSDRTATARNGWLGVVVAVGILTLLGDSPGGLGPPKVHSVEVVPEHLVLSAIGDTATLSAVALDLFGSFFPDAQYSWTSSNPTVAVVVARGDQALITAIGPGLAFIVAKADGVGGASRVVVDVD